MFLANGFLKQPSKCLQDITTKPLLLMTIKAVKCVLFIVSPEFHMFSVLSFVF